MDVSERFYKLLDSLEENLDRGFFLSFIGKIVVDEKKIYSVLNELRSLDPAGLKAAGAKSQAPVAPVSALPGDVRQVLSEAERKTEELRAGADRYADDVLTELEDRLTRMLGTVREGRRVIRTRIGTEVNPNATAEI